MFESIIKDALSVKVALICFAVSLALGVLVALVYSWRNNPSRNFRITLIVVPSIVQALIMMVNGNLGTGVAVLGAFSLVRFRSLPGNSKDISFIFLSTAIGIATGIGQVWFAVVMCLILCTAYIIYTYIPEFRSYESSVKALVITVPESLDYESELAPILTKYATKVSITRVKTSNMGSLFTIEYRIALRQKASQKAMIDELRIRNSNLPITCSSYRESVEEL